MNIAVSIDLDGSLTCHHVRPVAQILAASVRTTGVPRHDIPPYMLEWLSEATASVPGQA